MDLTPYLAACLLAALFAVAVISWLLARYQRRHLRREEADRMLHALQRYSAWVCAQRLAAVFHGEGRDAAAALNEACTIRRAWFPELAADMAELMATHNRILHFLSTQQALWQRDPEHWIESEHDKRFVALWRQHRHALEALLHRLAQLTSARIQQSATPPRRQSTYA